MQKFTTPSPAMFVISTLLVAQYIGMAIFAQYILRHHTWTGSLNIFAILKLGAAMAEDIPLVSAMQAKEAKALDERAGWIGDGGPEGQKVRTWTLGGPERVRYDALYRLVPDDETGSPEKSSEHHY